MDSHVDEPRVMQLRVSLTARDYERIRKFYCIGLGIAPSQSWEMQGSHGVMLEMGKASLELFDEGYAEHIDNLEVGRKASGPIRLALQVPSLQSAMERLLENGAILVHPPVLTPWGDYNVRLQDPDGMQVTLFEVRNGERGENP